MKYRKEPVRDYPEYQVDTEGNVYNKNGSLKAYSINPRGYASYTFCINGKCKTISGHTIVAKQFLPLDSYEGLQVNHKDGNKTNNNVDNLEWVTPHENAVHRHEVLGKNYGATHNLSKPIYSIDKKGCRTDYPGLRAACRTLVETELGKRTLEACRTGIWKALNGILKTYLGRKWFYQ